MSKEALKLLDSRLSRLKADHENSVLFAGNAPLGAFDPLRKRTHGIAIDAYVVALRTELHEHAARVRTEVMLVVDQLLLPLSPESKAAVLDLAAQKFDKDLYPKRLKMFVESMVRKGGHCGLKVDEWGLRTDLEHARLSAGTSTFIYRELAKLADELELVRLRSPPLATLQNREGKVEQANRVLKLEPNVFGIGINLNYLIRRWFGKKD